MLARNRAAPAPASLVVFNASYTRSLPLRAQYEELQLIAAVAGLANRHAPCLYVAAYDADAYWLARLTKPGGWLGAAELNHVQAPSAEALLKAASACGPGGSSPWSGAVLYDPAVLPTSLIAETAAGVEGLLPVASRPGDPTSLYSRLVASGPRLAVRRSLLGVCNGSLTGSIKLDCYRWAVREFLPADATRAGSVDGGALAMGYYVDYWAALNQPSGGDAWDKSTVLNHDWVIARGGFLFDLGAWPDQAPRDDPHQPAGSDFRALNEVLGAASAVSSPWPVHIAGFTPWAYKYVTSKHPGVATEWQTVRLASAYSAFADADACCVGNMANAALFRHYPLPADLPVPPAPSAADLVARGVMDDAGRVPPGLLLYFVYMGDYDSAAWAYGQLVPEHWDDPGRGSQPLGWAVDPGLMPRFPPLFDVLSAELAPGDALITGDSGANYINPTMLSAASRRNVSGLPDGWEAWEAWSRPLFATLGVRSTGFVITGDAPQLGPDGARRLAGFSPNGASLQDFPGTKQRLDPSGRMPMWPQTDLPGGKPPAEAAATVTGFVPPSPSSPTSLRMFRSVLQPASFGTQVVGNASAASGGRAVGLDPVSLAYAARALLSGRGLAANGDLPTVTARRCPASLPASLPSSLDLAPTLRNDGWTALPASYGLAVNVTALRPGAGPLLLGSAAARLPRGGLAPSAEAALDVTVPLRPAPAGTLALRVAMQPTGAGGGPIPGIVALECVVPLQAAAARRAAA